MRFNILTAEGLEVGYVTDTPEFRWEITHDFRFKSQVESFLQDSADYQMVVAGSEEPVEDAVTPPEEDVPATDRLRTVRVAQELPRNLPVRVERSDDTEKIHIAEDLVHAVDKARRYVDSPDEAPDDVEVQEGPQGGYYYETERDEEEEGREELPSVPPEADEDPQGGEWNHYRSMTESFDRINVGDTVAFNSVYEDPSVVIGEVVEWSEDAITIETADGEKYTEEYNGGYSVYTFEEETEEEARDLEERWEDSSIPQDSESASEMYIENLRRHDEDVDAETVERWRRIFDAGIEGLDEEHAETILEGYEATQGNSEWQELVDATGIDEDVIAINPDSVKEEVGHAAVGSNGGGKYIAGTAFVRAPDSLILIGNDRRPEPGQPTVGRSAAGIIRHELSHKIWEQRDDEFREWFAEQLPEDGEIRDGLTEYAANRDAEEAFNELITITTNPDYNPQMFPEWVDNLSQEVRDRLGASGEKAEKVAQKALERRFQRLKNERRESFVKVDDLKTPDADLTENSTFRKAGENFEQVDDMLMEAFEKQIWETDMTKAPNMWQRDDEVPQFVRSHVKDAIDKTDALHGEFDDIPHAAALKVHQIIKNQLTDPQGWSIETIAKALADEFQQMAIEQAENIARTEVASVLNKARELALDAAAMAEAANEAQNITGMPEQEALEDFKDDIGYYWSGPQDSKTTELCSSVKDEIEGRGGYVTKNELKEILREKAREYKEESGGLPERVDSFIPHYSCRHTFIREDYQKINP